MTETGSKDAEIVAAVRAQNVRLREALKGASEAIAVAVSAYLMGVPEESWQPMLEKHAILCKCRATLLESPA